MTKNDDLRAAVEAAYLALDPKRQGHCWPNPATWDGRPLAEQASDLLAVLAGFTQGEALATFGIAGADELEDATSALRAALEDPCGGRACAECEIGGCDYADREDAQ